MSHDSPSTSHTDELPIPKWAPRWMPRVRVLTRLVSNNYRQSQITRMAAALSFRTIFAIIPVLVIGLVVLHRFVSEEQVRHVVTSVLEYTGLTNIVVEKTEPAKQAAAVVPGINIFGGSMMVPVSPAEAQQNAQSARLDEFIKQLMSRVESINFGAIGFLGAIMLIYAALSMVVETEKAFNQIAGAAAGKTWVRRITQYWALLTLGPVFLVLSFGVGEAANRTAKQWVGVANESKLVSSDGARSAPPIVDATAVSPPSTTSAEQASFGRDIQAHAATRSLSDRLRHGAVSTVGFLLSCVISAVMLLVLYTSIPNARIHVPSALAGAAFAAFVWEASKWAFTAYVRFSTGYAQLYGVIALIPLFLLWVYVTWIVVMLGFQVTVIMQTYRKVSREGFKRSLLVSLGITPDPRDNQAGGVLLVHPASSLVVMCAIAQRFRAGQTSDRQSISLATSLDEGIVDVMLKRLHAASLLVEVVDNDPTIDTFSLARAPEAILATEVIALNDPPATSIHGEHAPIATTLDKVRRDAFFGKSLADVLATLSPQPIASVNTPRESQSRPLAQS
jgi:membrane protein